MRLLVPILAVLLAAQPLWAEPVRPKARPVVDPVPVARWDFRSESDRWSLASIDALKGHGRRLVEHTPRDIGRWCPGYARATPVDRRAFWVGFLSALAKHESTWKPRAVGGGGLWYGLLQILPSTARHYGCNAGSGAELQDGSANLSCAIRIMARTVPRDGVISASEPRWSGVAADWGPMRSPEKRRDMRRWLRSQDYCQISVSPRPAPRPAPDQLVYGPYLPMIPPVPRPEGALRFGVAPASSLDEATEITNDEADGDQGEAGASVPDGSNPSGAVEEREPGPLRTQEG